MGTWERDLNMGNKKGCAKRIRFEDFLPAWQLVIDHKISYSGCAMMCNVSYPTFQKWLYAIFETGFVHKDLPFIYVEGRDEGCVIIEPNARNYDEYLRLPKPYNKKSRRYTKNGIVYNENRHGDNLNRVFDLKKHQKEREQKQNK